MVHKEYQLHFTWTAFSINGKGFNGNLGQRVFQHHQRGQCLLWFTQCAMILIKSHVTFCTTKKLQTSADLLHRVTIVCLIMIYFGNNFISGEPVNLNGPPLPQNNKYHCISKLNYIV